MLFTGVSYLRLVFQFHQYSNEKNVPNPSCNQRKQARTLTLSSLLHYPPRHYGCIHTVGYKPHTIVYECKIKVQYNECNMFCDTKCLSLLRIPTFREMVFDIASIWFLQVRISSIITPWNLVELTLLNDSPSSWIFSLCFFNIIQSICLENDTSVLVCINEFRCKMMSTKYHTIGLACNKLTFVSLEPIKNLTEFIVN